RWLRSGDPCLLRPIDSIPTALSVPLSNGPWSWLVRKTTCLLRPRRAFFDASMGRVMIAVPGMVHSALAAVADVLVAPRWWRPQAGGRRQNLPTRGAQ